MNLPQIISSTFLTAINPMEELLAYLKELEYKECVPIEIQNTSNNLGRSHKPFNPRDLSEPKIRYY